MLRVLALLIALPAIAAADDKGEHDLGRGYRLEVEQTGVVVTKAGQRASLQGGVIGLGKVTVTGGAVDADVEDITCVGSHHYRWTFDHLDARLANSAAFALHRRKSYKDAAAGFAKAAAADPSWAIPAYNLASARTLMGDLDGAIATLSSRLASDPIVTYMHVSSDPELRPLLARKELIALHAKTPGTSKLAADALDGGLAYAPERGLVAVLHEEHSWGSGAFGATVEVYDIKSSKLVASTDLVQWSETDPMCYSKGCGVKASARAAVADRVAKAQAVLRELGFSPIAMETATVEDGPPRKAYLSTAKLGVASADGVARVLRGNTVLATASGLHGRLEKVMYVEPLRLFVLWSFLATGEGCDGYPENAVTTLTITP
ncbi:MAG TPA: hypothetical protein VGO00_19425 [Kofleriaceae bacterium]|nr:hypothetical protein [Kofleriaceae bacterium]